MDLPWWVDLVVVFLIASPVVVIVLALVLRYGFEKKNAWLIPAIYYVIVHFLRLSAGFWDIFLQKGLAMALDYGLLALSLGYLVYKVIPFFRELRTNIYK